MHWSAAVHRAGGVTRNVQCEKCHEWYHYEVQRRVLGQAAAGGPDAALRRANLVAQANVIHAIDDAVEVCPCPMCHWVQADMVRDMRKDVAPLLRVLIKIVAAATLIVSLFLIFPQWFLRKPGTRINGEPAQTVFFIGLGIVILLVIARSFFKSRINPNANYPQLTPVPGAINGRRGKVGGDKLQRTARPV